MNEKPARKRQSRTLGPETPATTRKPVKKAYGARAKYSGEETAYERRRREHREGGRAA